MFNTEAESQLLQFHLESQKVDFCLRESRQVLFLQLSKLGDSLDDLDELMKNHQDLEKLVLSQEQNIRNLENLSSNLPDDEDVATNMSLLLARLKSLQADCQVRRRMLEDSSQYLQLRNRWNMMKEQQELEVKEKLEKLVDFAKNIRPNYRRIEISKIEYEACGHLQLLALAKQSRYLQDRDCSEDSYKFQQFERLQ